MVFGDMFLARGLFFIEGCWFAVVDSLPSLMLGRFQWVRLSLYAVYVFLMVNRCDIGELVVDLMASFVCLVERCSSCGFIGHSISCGLSMSLRHRCVIIKAFLLIDP